jgi:hypothetical protein
MIDISIYYLSIHKSLINSSDRDQAVSGKIFEHVCGHAKLDPLPTGMGERPRAFEKFLVKTISYRDRRSAHGGLQGKFISVIS